MKTCERPRQDWFLRSRCQNHRNDRAPSPIELVQKSYDFSVLPRTNTVLTNTNCRRFYCFNLLSDGGVPEASGSDIRFIQPSFNVLLRQPLRDLTNSRLVFAVVAQENIKDFSFGVLRDHTEGTYTKNARAHIGNPSIGGYPFGLIPIRPSAKRRPHFPSPATFPRFATLPKFRSSLP